MTRNNRGWAAVAVLSLAVGLSVPQGAPAQWKVMKTLSDHKGGVNSLAFSPDGKLLASASSDSKVGLWDAVTGKHVTFLKGHKGRVFCVAFSPDGKAVASGGENRIVTWDAVKHTDRGALYDLPADRFDSPDPNVLSIAYSPEGDRLMAAGYALVDVFPYKVYSKCVIFETRSGKAVRDLPSALGFTSPEQAVPSPDWKVLVRWAGDALQLVDPTNVEAKPRALPTRGGSPLEPTPLGMRVGFSPDGENVWAFSISNPEHSLRLWKYDKRRLKLEEETAPWRAANVVRVTTAAFCPDGKTLAVGMNVKQDDGEEESGVPVLKLFEYREGKLDEIRELATEHARAITAIAFSPDGKTMATGCQGGFIKLWAN